MKLLIALVVVSAVSVNAGSDWKMFMKWAKTKAMESCWGEENMKLHTLNMKKAVSKCLQVDAPETDLPPFRYLNRFTNNLVNMANNRHQYGYEHGDQEMMKLMKMMMMVKMMNSFGGHNEDHHSQRHGCNGFHDCDDNSYGDNGDLKRIKIMMRGVKKNDAYEYDRIKDNMDMHHMHPFRNMKSKKYDFYKVADDYINGYRDYSPSILAMRMGNMKSNEYDSYKVADDYSSPMMKRFMSSFQKRQAGDYLELNDRLKEKLERLMEEHVSEMSNMTCVLREMNVLDTRNKIDIAAMKADVQNYQMPSEWFKDQYFAILDNCQEVAENQPAELDNMYNMPGMQHLGTVKSFMTCAKTAKMRLCMNQDTKKKIETNFGPVEELLQSFNNQINEEQLFFMVNELLQGDDQEWM